MKLIFYLSCVQLANTFVGNAYTPADESRMEEVDDPSTVHVSQHEGNNEDNKRIANIQDTWVTSIVDKNDYVEYVSLALDGQGKAHISYLGTDSEALKYATNASGTWVTTTVDDGLESDLYSSIALDKEGKAHISYCDFSVGGGALKYATNVSGKWVTTTIDNSVPYTGLYTSIAVNSRDKVHISYYNWNRGVIKYATNDTGKWNTTDVAGGSGHTSLALDEKDNAYISYHSSIGGLKYATNITGTWVATTVDSDGDVGIFTSLALDKGGKAHISYHNDDNGNLKYATNASGKWVTTTVDSNEEGDLPLYSSTSIALDKGSKVHISYHGNHGFTGGNLKYATNASGTWVITDVDIFGHDTGLFSSIALDRKDTIHISYPGFTDARENALKYVTKASDTSPPCQPVNMTADQKKVDVAAGSSEQETITITCDDGTPVAGETVKAKVKSGKDMVTVTPSTSVTDNDGHAVFTITAMNKSGKAKVEFKDKKAGLKTRVKVEVSE